jgi:hypothetical protein
VILIVNVESTENGGNLLIYVILPLETLLTKTGIIFDFGVDSLLETVIKYSPLEDGAVILNSKLPSEDVKPEPEPPELTEAEILIPSITSTDSIAIRPFNVITCEG